jgi:tryptophan halogenase
MHICVIGDGTAGLMAANLFVKRNYVKKLTIIGSSKIPSIGVGESTTLNFETLHKMFDSDIENFIRNSNACVKTGVMYKDWSEHNFLHHFKNHILYEKYGTTSIDYSNSLGNKDKDIFIHNLIGTKIYSDSIQNKIPQPQDNITSFYGTTWHFDAGKYIEYLKSILNTKATIVDDKVVSCKFRENKSIDFIALESGSQIKADYYIISTGKSTESSKIFQIEYEDLSNILLTNKALFLPLKYQNKKKELHPYTIAKTMNNGWRWITPTWERIGTGYVFSSNHISVEGAIDELRDDIGDQTIEPNVVDFHPRYSKSTFNSNYCAIGMSNGFLEPLDAPGLAISCTLTMLLDNMFHNPDYLNSILKQEYSQSNVEWLNQFVENFYLGWASFILTQYKTCIRSDTEFWEDHKNVEFEYLNNLMGNLNNKKPNELHFINDPKIILDAIDVDIKMMIQHTISSKNIQWKTYTKDIPFKIDDSEYESIDHYEYISSFHKDLTNPQ